MGRPKGKPVRYRKVSILLDEEAEQAARAVLAAQALAGKRPALASAVRTLLREEARRLASRDREARA